MAIHVEHELHQRRRGRNLGLLVVLIAFAAIVFGLTMVKVLELGDISTLEGFDHGYRPALIPEAAE